MTKLLFDYRLVCLFLSDSGQPQQQQQKQAAAGDGDVTMTNAVNGELTNSKTEQEENMEEGTYRLGGGGGGMVDVQ